MKFKFFSLQLIIFIVVTLIFTIVKNAYAQYSGLGSESVSTEKLKHYAPPSLPAEQTNYLKNLLDISTPGAGMLSPDKKTLYFTWKVTGQNQVWKINGPQKFPVQLTSGQDAVQLVDVSANGKFLIISKDLNGKENPGLFKLDVETGFVTELYRKEKVQAQFGFLTADSQSLFFTANDQKPDSYNVYKLNLKTLEKELIFEGDGAWFIADELNDGKKLLLVKYNGGRINEYYNYEVSSKKLIPLIGQGEQNEYTMAYLASENEYIVLTALDNFKRLYKYNPLKKSGRDGLTLISDKKLNFDIDQLDIDQNRKRIMYSVNKDGYIEFRAMSLPQFKEIKITALSKQKLKNIDHVYFGKTTRDSKTTMLSLISSQFPRLSYSFDWQTQKLTQWVLPSAPQIDLTKFVVSKLMTYQTRDGAKIPMFVRFPQRCEKTFDCPVVVHFHGGPEAQSQPGFSVYAQAFIDSGFIFIEPNVRGSDGYGKAWIDMDNGPLRENVITDIPDAANWIKENWKNSQGQSPRVGIMGWSYGGYSTLMGMTRFAGAYDAGVALVGMSNLVSFLNNTAPYRRKLRISEYGDPEKDKDALIKLSPMTYVEQVKAPLMIIQGANDPRVPVGEAIQIHETLKKKKISSELIIFADEGHGSSKKENQILEIGNAIEFFKKHLK